MNMLSNRTFTSSLPVEVINRLDSLAKKFDMPKNKLIEKALNFYFDQLRRAEYIKSYRAMSGDPEMIHMAEEGLEEYQRILDEEQ